VVSECRLNHLAALGYHITNSHFKKAFSSLVRDVICQVLEEYKVPKKIVNMIKGLYEGFKCHTFDKGKLK